MVEIAAKAEFLIEDLHAVGGALREDDRHRLFLAAHHFIQPLAGAGDGLGNSLKTFTIASKFRQQSFPLLMFNRAGAEVTPVSVAVVAVGHAVIQQALKQLLVARQQTASAHNGHGVDAAGNGIVRTALYQPIDIDGV